MTNSSVESEQRIENLNAETLNVDHRPRYYCPLRWIALLVFISSSEVRVHKKQFKDLIHFYERHTVLHQVNPDESTPNPKLSPTEHLPKVDTINHPVGE